MVPIRWVINKPPATAGGFSGPWETALSILVILTILTMGFCLGGCSQDSESLIAPQTAIDTAPPAQLRALATFLARSKYGESTAFRPASTTFPKGVRFISMMSPNTISMP